MKIDRKSLKAIVNLGKAENNLPFAVYYEKESGMFFTDLEAPEEANWIYDMEEPDDEDFIIGMVAAVLEDID